MRSYPRNSPEAAARLVALVMICDGHVCRSEIEALNGMEAEGALGLAPGGFSKVVHVLCEDLLMGSHDGGASFGRVDDDTLTALLDEVDQPALQLQVLKLATAAAAADSHLADAEALVLDSIRAHWPLARETGLDRIEPAPQGA